MSARWYYKSSAGETGPLSAADLRDHVKAGTVTGDTPVRRTDAERWVRAGNVKGLFSSPPSQPSRPAAATPLPTGANAATSKNVLGKWVVKYDCPKCKLRFKSPIGEAGEKDACPECGCEFIVPGQAKRIEVERLATEQAEEAEQLKALRQSEAQAKKEQKQLEAVALQREEENRERELRQQAQFQRSQEAAVVRPAMLVWCPYCHGEIHRGVKKCRHCGEFLVGTGHSDVLAGCLGFLLGPLGLWYKGHYLAGLAWFAFWLFFVLFVLLTSGVALLALPFAPLLWIAMAIHAACVKGVR